MARFMVTLVSGCCLSLVNGLEAPAVTTTSGPGSCCSSNNGDERHGDHALLGALFGALFVAVLAIFVTVVARKIAGRRQESREVQPPVKASDPSPEAVTVPSLAASAWLV
mmetsp:Transcript_73184/g.152759  ORF Transcript_73184/g.152759 Transcript_73184/m.152759 type:complete len:110 (-) Transcript_73184:23-352(-)